MRDVLKSSGCRLRGGWFWPLVLLALPACGLNTRGTGPAFDPGSEPRTGRIMCDIPKVPEEGSNPCATEADVNEGIPLEEAAIALRNGKSSTIGLGLDFSKTCSNGMPRKRLFYGPFPDGLAVCLNCGTQIPARYADANAVCVAKCKDLIYYGPPPFPEGGITAFCQANARASTNFAEHVCFADACSSGGMPDWNFWDPRRDPEPVKWHDASLIDTEPIENSLRRVAGDGVAFNAGAASAPLITKGDGWVEFEANEPNMSHALGLSASCTDVSVCPDQDPSLNGIGFAIMLANDWRYYVFESGNKLAGPGINGSYGSYYSGERFRVRFKNNFDGTAAISYWRVVGQCLVGVTCTEELIATHNGPGPAYPLRVDASLWEVNAMLVNVTLVRIH
jgi:hypothetical protein